MFYYSLKTDKEEHCLEPRIFGGYDYGIYDLEQNLKKKKTIVKQEDVVKFIFDTQVKLGAKFIKMTVNDQGVKAETVETPEPKPEQKKEEAPKTEQVSEDAFSSKFKQQVAEELGKRGAKTAYSEDKIIETASGERIHQQNHAIQREPVSEKEFEENKDKFRLIAELNHNTGMVSIEVNSVPHENVEVTCERGMEIIDKVLRAVVQTFPELIDNHFISAGVKQTGQSYEEFSKNYKKSSNIPLKARSRCLTALKKAVDNYKDELTK